MTEHCFNCNKEIEKAEPICSYCYAVQRNRFSRAYLFSYLEQLYPTRPRPTKKISTTKKGVTIRDYDIWLVRGVFTLGWGYFYYLLLTLEDLNDHWYLPHHKYEHSTKSDVFIAFVLFSCLGIFALPFIQYVRYEKLRRHLLKLPEWEDQPVPRQGKLVAVLNSVMVLLYFATIASAFFGISTLVAGLFFTTNTILIAIAFLIGSVILLFLSIIVTLQAISYEQKWQETINQHFKWHLNQIDQEKALKNNS